MVLSDDLGLARHGKPDEVFVSPHFCSKYISFSHEITAFGVALEFTKLFVIVLFILEMSQM